MYLALYRKYKPKKFQNLIGHDVIIKTLKNAIKHQKIHHCYLFSGDKGVGKTTLAKILAKSINCSHFAKNEDCCDEYDREYCPNCALIDKKKNLDIIEIDGASYSGVDEIRELKDKLFYKPNFLKYKIYIIDEIHVLSPNAFNALLKVLEDPPSSVIFIFITSEFNKVPKNFFSRTQYFYLNNISQENIQKKLKSIAEEEKIIISDQTLSKISFYANGSLREPLNLLDQANSYTEGRITDKDIEDILNILSEEQIKTLFSYLFQKEILQLITFLQSILLPKVNLVNFLNDVINFFQKLVIDFSKNNSSNFSFFDSLDFEQKEKILDKLLKLQNDLLLSKEKKNLLIVNFIHIHRILHKENIINSSLNEENKNTNTETNVSKNNFVEDTIDYDTKTTFREEFLSNIINILKSNDESSKNFLQKGWAKLKNYPNSELSEIARILFNSKLLLINDNKEILLSCRDKNEYKRFLNSETRTKIKNIFNAKKNLISEYIVVLEDDWDKILEPVYLKFSQTKNPKDLDLSHFQTDFYEQNSVLNIIQKESQFIKLAKQIFVKDKIEIFY
ncbi:DNA polymerase III subunit gamma/tau ['Camptotheca acuminata' phytoplasma]|uniref:DNA polymerase III subunit gamma/tau n=1 Tax='Camptotheca acuminata' phytoplasma TaxID=3239192 RepID=UPI00351A4331